MPDFNGGILDYPDFKATFNALTQGQGYMDEAILIYLKRALPSSAKHLLTGTKTVEQAWERLDNRFGNTHQRTLAIYERLSKVELKGKDHERVEKLHYEVEAACLLLEQTGSVSAFKNDLYIVNVVVSKLPAMWIDKWLEHAESQEEAVIPGGNEWKIFRSWLAKCYKVAIRARNTTTTAHRGVSGSGTAAPASKPAASSEKAKFCARCKSYGHTGS